MGLGDRYVQSLHSLSLGKKHKILALYDDSELISCAKGESVHDEICSYSQWDVQASGYNWSVIIQPQDRYSKVDVLLSLTNKHLYLAVASSSLDVHASLFLQVQFRKGKDKIGNGLGDQPPLRESLVPAARVTKHNKSQRTLKACPLRNKILNSLILSV